MPSLVKFSKVPQNRNSLVSAAIQRFIDSSVSRIQQIDQKFSEAGHSQIQEVDTAHSVIEKFLRRKFIYSPPALLNEIRKIPEGKLKFVVVEMEDCDYLDYQLLAHAYNYTVIPYTKVKQLTYKKNQSNIWMKLDFPDDVIERSINLKPSKVESIKGPLNLTLSSKVSTQKIADIRCMYGIMSETDRLFYENIFVNVNTDAVKTESTNAPKDLIKTKNCGKLYNPKVKPKQLALRSSSASQESKPPNALIQRSCDGLDRNPKNKAPKIVMSNKKNCLRASSKALSPGANIKDQPTTLQPGTQYKAEDVDDHAQFAASTRIGSRKRELPAFLRSYKL